MTVPGIFRGGRNALAALVLFSLVPATAQTTRRPTFDYVSRLPVPADAALLAGGDFNGDGLPDLIAAGSRGFSIYLQGKTSFEWSGNSGKLSKSPVLIATGRINGDGRDDLVVYSSDPPTVSLYLAGRNGVPVFRSSFGVGGDFGGMSVSDLDGDGSSDILLFGKKTPGVEVFRGSGGGKFTAVKVLHPDISISLVCVARMDDDEMPDMVAVDWVSNKILVSSGFGKMNFSDPAVIPSDREPSAIAVGDLNADGVTDIVRGFGEQPGFDVLTGDGSGRYATFTTGALPAAPSRIAIGEVNGDTARDLVFFTPTHGSVSARYDDTEHPFREGQVFSTGPKPSEVVFFPDSRRQLLNAAVLPRSGQAVRILHNRTERFPGPAGWEFVTGSNPGEIEFADLNSDSWTDVILAERSDRAVNVFMNNGRGNLLGMVSVAVPKPARALMPLSADGGMATFLTTGADDRTLTFTMISAADFSGESRMITVGSGVVAIDATRRLPTSLTRIYATRPGARGGLYRLSAFDVAGDNRYEEIEIPITIGGIPSGTLSHDFNHDGLRDLAVVTRRDSVPGLELQLFMQTPEGFTPARSALFDLQAGPEPVLTLWGGDLNSDGNDDLVINGSRPLEHLYVSLSEGDSAFGPAVAVMSGVRVPGRQGLVVVDFNSDGITDLVFLNEKTKTIQFLPGEGDGYFSGPVNLMSAKDAIGIGVADLNRDSEQELLVSGGEQGTLTITSFHHPLFERRKK